MSWTVHGKGGFVYTLGEEHGFTEVPLEPCNDGWDWVAPEAIRHWTTDPVFEVFEGGRWRAVAAEKVHPCSGSVSFTRCLSGHVRATGRGLSASRLTAVGRWTVVVESVVPVVSVMGGPRLAEFRQTGAHATLDVNVTEQGDLYTWLPHGRCVVVGVGRALAETVVYNEKGVSYDPLYS